MKRIALWSAVGAALVYFFDPQAGARRRHGARDRVTAFFRRRARAASHAARHAKADAYGAGQKLRHREEVPKDYDDATLAHKVESEIFRDIETPKGSVSVNAEGGVIQLRGEVNRAELIDELVERTRRVQGVRGVENLLHLPGTPAPMHQ